MICPCCGNDVTSVHRELKMELPDAVRAIPEDVRRTRVGVGGTAFMQLDLKRFFVRALLPVRLSDGHEFHFGVCLETPVETFKRLWTNWELPEESRRISSLRTRAVILFIGPNPGSAPIGGPQDRMYAPGIGPHHDDMAVRLILNERRLFRPGCYESAWPDPYPTNPRSSGCHC